jgi:hypothetical protein
LNDGNSKKLQDEDPEDEKLLTGDIREDELDEDNFDPEMITPDYSYDSTDEKFAVAPPFREGEESNARTDISQRGNQSQNKLISPLEEKKLVF